MKSNNNPVLERVPGSYHMCESDFCGDPRKVAEMLSSLADAAEEKGYFDLFLDVVSGYQETTEIVLLGKREPTESELRQRRLSAARARAARKKAKEVVEKREKKEFERLKKKYGETE